VGNAHIPFAPVFTFACRLHNWRIGPGRHAFRMAIATTDLTPFTPTTNGQSSFQKLPPGTYHTSIVFGGKTPKWMPLPPPITVHLTSS
jgi:hypothetical protein